MLCEISGVYFTYVSNFADAIFAAHKPLAQWAVEGVLLSSDLVPHLLAPLQLEDGAAAAVCSRWAEGWKATSEGRRRLRKVAFDFPQELLDTGSFSMAVIPGGDEQLVVRSDDTLRILDGDMICSTSLDLSVYADYGMAASEEFVYAGGGNRVRCLTHDGTEVANWQDPEYKVIGYPVLAPGGLLFCVLMAYEEDADEIVALDAQTLQLRYRFGLSLLNDTYEIAVVGEELFVCDYGNDRLQVFSLAGEHRRSITGEWKWPTALCVVKDRLYLVAREATRTANDNSQDGLRIFVLSLQGDILQVYTHPVVGQTFETLCYFDGKLLASVQNESDACVVGVVALLVA